MKRNSWWLWTVSGLNLGLGLVIGWLATQWVLIGPGNVPMQRGYVPEVRPLPPQIGRGTEQEEAKVPEPVELSQVAFEFNEHLALSGRLESLQAEAHAAITENKLQLGTFSTNKAQSLSGFEESQLAFVEAQLVTSSSVIPDAAQVQELILKTTKDQHEQQVWEETLSGMPLEAVEDILKFRRSYGMASQPEPNHEPTESTAITPQNIEASQHAFYVPAVEELTTAKQPVSEVHGMPSWKKETVKHLDQEIKCLETIASMQAYNIANAKVPWFRRVVPQVESNGLSGAEMKRSEVSPVAQFSADHGPEVVFNMTNDEPKLIASKDNRDIALSGNGLFQVLEEGTVFYLRGGKLSINDNGLLCIKAGKDHNMFPLEPAVSIPSDINLNELEITANGMIQAKQGDELLNFGCLMLVRILDHDCYEEPEPGLFVAKEQELTSTEHNQPFEQFDLSSEKNSGKVQLMIGKIGGSTVNPQQELKQFEKTLSQIAKLKELKQQVLAK